MRALLLCLAAAGASLLLQRTPTFDPTAWLIWGRQIADGTLYTLGGPSWKPLPVAFTTVFAPAGDTVAPWLWLVVARAGGLLAVVEAYRVTARLGGRTAGWIAAASLALATDFLYNAARGDSEGLLVLFALLALELHIGGRRHAALLVGALTGLIRPEVWPLLLLYGLWELCRPGRARTLLLLVGIAVGLAAAWFIPEHIGSGDWFRAATRAQNPVAGSPGQSALPFLFVFLYATVAVTWPVYAGAVRAVLAAWRGEAPRVLLHVGAAATLLMVIVASLAERGFTGNLRYVTLPAALLCVLAGVGVPLLVEDARRWTRRGAVRAAAVAAAIGVLVSVGLLGRNAVQLATYGRIYGRELPQMIALAGGEDAIKACAPLGASHFERQAVAYLLHVRQQDVSTGLIRRGTALIRANAGAAVDGTLPIRARLGAWILRSTCPLGSPTAGGRAGSAGPGARAGAPPGA